MPRKPKEQPHPYYIGQPVAITQVNTFKGKKLAVVVGKCKYNDGGIICSLVNSKIGFNDICVKVDQGDTIEDLSRRVNGSPESS